MLTHPLGLLLSKGGDLVKILHIVAYALVFVGGLNWGLVGLLDMNLVSMIFGSMGLENIVYILVGLSTVFVIYDHMQTCKVCKGGK